MMIRIHKIRWLWVYIFIFLVSALILIADVERQIVHVIQKNREEKNFLVKVEESKKAIMNAIQAKPAMQVDNTLLDTAGVLDYLSRTFSGVNIAVNKIQLLKIKTINGANALPVKVSAVGQFSDFFKLICALSEGVRPMVVSDFLFQKNADGAVTAEMRFLMFGVRGSRD